MHCCAGKPACPHRSVPKQATGCLNIDQKYWHPSPVAQRNVTFLVRMLPSACTFWAFVLACWLRLRHVPLETSSKKTKQKGNIKWGRDGGDASFVLFSSGIRFRTLFRSSRHVWDRKITLSITATALKARSSCSAFKSKWNVRLGRLTEN